MPSDYENICKDNIRRRGEEFDDIGRLISEQLYSDRTHFIYELLQNAEDALGRRKRNNPESELSTNVKFLLYKDCLEFRHFGENFNTNDVKGISDVLKGTKSEDNTQIGKFGIGFKSVYAFTSTPEIHSGNEHFTIERYIRPRSADRIPQISDGETIFVFPFNHKDLSKEQAFQLIEEKLKIIGSRVLLFLRNITEIEWKIEDQDEGLYLKESKQQGRFSQKVTVIGQHGNEDEEEEWLVFRRHLEVANSSFESFVEVAFRLKDDRKIEKQIIQKTESSPLVVYFPTKLETRFGFLVQGPYDTTASRSDVEDNKWNNDLIKETAFLVTDQVLPTLKQMGLLTVSFIEALPIRMGDFPEDGMFYPIVEAVHDALLYQELLPTDNGAFVSARNAKLASAEWLRTLLRDEQLKHLFKTENSLKWISGEITERAKHDLWKYIREEMEVEEITPDSFARKIGSSFLEKQTDDWMINFYTHLSGQKALWKKGSNSWYDKAGPLRGKQFIRLQDGSHARPFIDDGAPNVYLPPENETEFAVVKGEITKNENALEFLKNLGLTEPDAVAEVIEHILPKYSHDQPHIPDDEHMRDMKKILYSYSTDSHEKKVRLVKKLEETAFVRAENLVLQQIEYKKPGQLYLRNKELFLYFDGNKSAWFIDKNYPEDFEALFKELLVGENLRVKRKDKDNKGYVVIQNSHGWHKRGLNGFDSDIEIDALEYALAQPTVERSSFIWNCIGIVYADCVRGIIESSSRKTYEGSEKKKQISQKFGRLLIDNPWLPDKQGNFNKPAELKLEDLPESYERNEKLGDQLCMKKDVVAKLAEEAGVSVDDINLIKQLKEDPEEYEKVKTAILTKKEGPEFPQKASSNVGRRKEKIIEKYHKATKKKYEKKLYRKKDTENTIDPKVWLRETYTNNEGQMICQICQNEMPFKKKDGHYYFEAIELLNDLDREMEEFHIALCPLCAAMYNEFVKTDKGGLEYLKNGFMDSEDAEVPLKLGELSTSVRFVNTHYNDIKTIFAEHHNHHK